MTKFHIIRIHYNCVVPYLYTGHHMSVIIWSWRLKSPTVPLLVPPFVQADTKENTKAVRQCPFVRGTHRWPVVYHQKGTVTHMMTSFAALLAICAGNSPVTGEFHAQRPVTRSFDVFFDLCLNKRLSKRSRGWLFETPSCSLWRHCNAEKSKSMSWLDQYWK